MTLVVIPPPEPSPDPINNDLPIDDSMLIDTDGDGYTDYEEELAGSDPNDPLVVPTDESISDPAVINDEDFLNVNLEETLREVYGDSLDTDNEPGEVLDTYIDNNGNTITVEDLDT